jgi:putative ABC transport system substrate-binding protein
MRRRDFAIGLALAAAMRSVRAQEREEHHRIAIIAAGPVVRIHDPGNPFFGGLFEELRRLSHVEGQNLSVDARIPAAGGPRAMPISLARSSTGTRR